MKAKPSEPAGSDPVAPKPGAEQVEESAGAAEESSDEQMKRKFREAIEHKHGSSGAAKSGHGSSGSAGHLAAGGPGHRMFRRKAGG
ncbi:MAG: DUF5302 family protein, partial [Candidatus Nanopelagicales bacterium]